jgi:hypothetical protein
MAYFLDQNEESRAIDRMLWFAAACLCACNLTLSIANAQHPPHRFPLTASQIVSAMEDRQLPTRGVQVSLAAAMTASIEDPPLEVQAVTLLSSHQVRLRISCRDRTQCLSFFAIATYPEDLKPATLKPTTDSPTSVVGRPVPSASTVAEAPVNSALVKSGKSVKQPIFRSGAPATLDFDEERIHIRIEVLCLESGAVGDKIRVTSRDRKQVYVAQVVTPTLLKGSF